MNCNTLIIGAGICGLAAARSLSRPDRRVVVLEARDRIGGRIHTIIEPGFSNPIEGGAEFVHGSPRLTMALINAAKAELKASNGQTWRVTGNREERIDLFPTRLDRVLKALNGLASDTTMEEFMENHFSSVTDKEIRIDVRRMIEGFDAADMSKISAHAVREEWSAADEVPGKRPACGYSQLIDYLARTAARRGATVHLNSCVQEISWEYGKVTAVVSNGTHYEAQRILVTVPAGVLKSGSIRFNPQIPSLDNALKKIEVGGVIKFLIEFNDAFWERPGLGFRHMKDLSFLFSDAFVPTWWTQRPSQNPLITGWLSGPVTWRTLPGPEGLMKEAIRSLAYIFNCSETEIADKVQMAKVVDWVADPLSRGAYGFNTPMTAGALEVITMPIAKTLYFAGEAFNKEGEMGTVEAALCSAKTAVARIRRDG